MILTILLSILTATFSLKSTTSVGESGVIPPTSMVSYERSANSGQKGQMTAGNATRLELRGWDGCTIHSVSLQMRSNTQSGVGSLTMKIGVDTVWAIYNQPFKEEVWAGQYSTNWVDIQKDMNVVVGEDECIEIIISATENSLYINSYTICYEAAVPQAYTVNFNTGLDTCPASISQTEPGVPIELPMWQDTACWHFVGWTEVEILEYQVLAPILPAGEEYVPRKNITLWAVYTDVKEYLPLEDYESGSYVIAYRNTFTEYLTGSGMAMCGGVEDGYVPIMDVEMQRNADSVYCLESRVVESMLYDVVFVDDSTLILKHSIEGAIGYKGNKIDSQESVWKYKVLEDGSMIIYCVYNNRTYALYMGYVGDEVGVYVQYVDIDGWTKDGFWLYPKIEKRYASWPFGKYDSVESIMHPESRDDAVYQLGIYKIHIRDGKKMIYLTH